MLSPLHPASWRLLVTAFFPGASESLSVDSVTFVISELTSADRPSHLVSDLPRSWCDKRLPAETWTGSSPVRRVRFLVPLALLQAPRHLCRGRGVHVLTRPVDPWKWVPDAARPRGFRVATSDTSLPGVGASSLQGGGHRQGEGLGTPLSILETTSGRRVPCPWVGRSASLERTLGPVLQGAGRSGARVCLWGLQAASPWPSEQNGSKVAVEPVVAAEPLPGGLRSACVCHLRAPVAGSAAAPPQEACVQPRFQKRQWPPCLSFRSHSRLRFWGGCEQHGPARCWGRELSVCGVRLPELTLKHSSTSK